MCSSNAPTACPRATTPHRPALVFPLGSVGAWGASFRWERADLSAPQHLRTEGKVAGWEEVTMPAGSFRALRVELLTSAFAVSQAGRFFPDLRQFGGIAETYWYAPQASSFVKHIERRYVGPVLIERRSLELAAFSAAPSPPNY